MWEIWASTRTLLKVCIAIILLLVSARLACHCVRSFHGRCSFRWSIAGLLHPHPVLSVFSLQKSAEKRTSSRGARAKSCSMLRSVQSASIRCVTTRKGTAKQGKGLIEIISTKALETCTGRREWRGAAMDKLLVSRGVARILHMVGQNESHTH